MNDIERIRRAHRNAKPKRSNPAWTNTHRDLGVVLDAYDLLKSRDELERLEAENERLRTALEFIAEHGPAADVEGIAQEALNQS